MADKDQTNGKSRQKIIIVIFIAVVAFLAWQVFGLFGGGESQTTAPAPSSGASPSPAQAPLPTPKPAELPQPAPLTPREMELMQIQQETEAKYMAAVNELQMLKIQRDIAETNKQIATANLNTVTAQKGVVTLLTPPQDTNYSGRLTGPVSTSPTGPTQQIPPAVVEIAYTVISVTEIQGRWGAIIGAQGKLYSVHVGDTLPADNSKVVSIDRSGVTLDKGGVKKTISLMPII